MKRFIFNQIDYILLKLQVHMYLCIFFQFRRPRTVYTSVAFDDSDIESTDSKPKHHSTRIHQDNSVDKSLPNPSNVSYVIITY